MSLAPGTRIGTYEVRELIGVGGMGEVYRATDSRLGRAIALKALPEALAQDPERLARFEREAKILAQLNHPHIAAIYGFEPGTRMVLAMELVDGDTLAQRIAAGPLDLAEAMVIARQIADALEHAHARGIVHRDLKPANIKSGPRHGDPAVKVLDFGLAKAVASSSTASIAGSSSTIASPDPVTAAGVVLGTAAYMAPEQARGRVTDHRADIWSFGCVFFEMICGKSAFGGGAITDILARVIQSEPDWTALPAATPPALESLLRRCLRKDPHWRMHSIADVRLELEEIGSAPLAAVPPSPRATQRTIWASALAGLAAGAAITAVIVIARDSRVAVAALPPVLRFTVLAPDGATFVRTTSNGRMTMALSPDGEKLAAVVGRDDSQRRIVVRRLDEPQFREVTGSDGAANIFWAPDSERIAFNTAGGVLRYSELAGDGSRPLASLPGLQSASWSTNDEIVAATGAGVLFHWTVGSEPVALGQLPTDATPRSLPRWLPGGESLLFLEALTNGTTAMLRQHRLGAGTVDVATIETLGSNIEYKAGHLLISVTDASGRTVLTAQPLDVATAKLSGETKVLATDLNVAFAASDTTLAFADSRTLQERLISIDGRGNEVTAVTDPMERMSNFDLSHDGRLIAIQQSNALFVHDLARGVTSQLSVRGSDPVWSPDDREIAFARLGTAGASGVYAVPSFGGAPRLLHQAKQGIPYPEDWSSDNQWISAVNRNKGMLIPIGQGGDAIVLSDAADSTQEDELHFSPDARWLAFGERRPGAINQVFLTTMPPGGERWRLSVDSGVQPRWRGDGRALYFLSMTGTLMMVEVALTPGARPTISPPRPVLDTGLLVQPTLDQYLLTKERDRFLLRRPVKDAASRPDQINVIVNWPTLLKTPGRR